MREKRERGRGGGREREGERESERERGNERGRGGGERTRQDRRKRGGGGDPTEQSELPASELAPPGQAEQFAAPSVSWNVPALHGRQSPVSLIKSEIHVSWRKPHLDLRSVFPYAKPHLP